ncbi:galectin [Trichophaea hybrida]|nr:galectin [Trichophaea hybrida]
MFYLLPLTQTVELRDDFTTDGIIVFQSDKLDLTPSGIDNTSISLLNAGDCLLVIAVRRNDNTIVFNSKTAEGGWGPEETETLEDKFPGPNTTITVYDHGDRYQILCDYHTVHYYTKRIEKNANSISYTINPDLTSPFSNPLAVTTYTSMEQFVPGN